MDPMEDKPHEEKEDKSTNDLSSSPAKVQAEVDYGTPELPESDRGHVTAEAAAKVDQDVHDSDWEMLSRNPSPSPDRTIDEPHVGHQPLEADARATPVQDPEPIQEDNPPHEEAVAAIGSSTEANAGDQEEQEAGMTIDAIPELVQMMTDIQAALTGPEGSPDLDQPASEAAADEDEAVCHQEEVHNEDIAQAIGTAIQVETNSLKDEDVAERSPPDSPAHLRSGVSSFSQISNPTSYQFSRDGDASDEEGSSWSSDEDDKSRRSGQRSEADSEEAAQDVCALSQEGSLGSYCGSDRSFKLRMAAAAESSRTLPKTDPEGASDGQGAPENPANVEDVLKVARRLSEVVAELSEGEGKQSAGEAEEVPRTGAFEEQRWDKKGASRRADVVGALRSGLDRLAEVSTSALQRVGSSDLLHRFWTCLEEWMSALLNCLPAAERARARLHMELGRMRARARRMGWCQIALLASLAIMAVVAGVAVVKNAALSRALRRKDQDMNQLILMVFNLQESLQNAASGSRVPIVRHASCGLSSFPAYGCVEPVSMIAFETLSGAVQC